MKVLVCGSRKWLDQGAIMRELVKLPDGTIVVHGACRGADNIAAYVAKELLGFEVRAYPAPWERFGKRAGILRNQMMLKKQHLDDEPIDKVLAFHKELAIGGGTADMVRRAEAAGIPVEVFTK